MNASRFVDHTARYAVEHDDALFPVLGQPFRQNENSGIEFRHTDLPVPAELNHLPFPASRIHLKQRHSLQVCR
jgi:hypothetical protein